MGINESTATNCRDLSIKIFTMKYTVYIIIYIYVYICMYINIYHGLKDNYDVK